MRCVLYVAVAPLADGYGGFEDDLLSDAVGDGAALADRGCGNAEAASDDEGAINGGLERELEDEALANRGTVQQGHQDHVPVAPERVARGASGKRGEPRVFADTDRLSVTGKTSKDNEPSGYPNAKSQHNSTAQTPRRHRLAVHPTENATPPPLASLPLQIGHHL